MAEHVVGRRGFLDPVRAVGLELVNPCDRVGYAPDLIGVHGDRHVGPDRRAGDAETSHVVGEVRADLQLDEAEAVGHGQCGQTGELLVVVPEPPRCGGVGRITVLEEVRLPLGHAITNRLKQRQSLVLGERVAQVPKVDQ